VRERDLERNRNTGRWRKSDRQIDRVRKRKREGERQSTSECAVIAPRQKN
jgi:hypothetical protein